MGERRLPASHSEHDTLLTRFISTFASRSASPIPAITFQLITLSCHRPPHSPRHAVTSRRPHSMPSFSISIASRSFLFTAASGFASTASIGQFTTDDSSTQTRGAPHGVRAAVVCLFAGRLDIVTHTKSPVSWGLSGWREVGDGCVVSLASQSYGYRERPEPSVGHGHTSTR